MHILVGLVLAAVLLYFWLIGHWFARVLAFLALAPALGLAGWIGGLAMVPPPSEAQRADARQHVSDPYSVELVDHYARQQRNDAQPLIGALLGLALAWPVAGLPIYIGRWRLKALVAKHPAPPPGRSM